MHASPVENALITKLFTNHSSEIRPSPNRSAATHVHLSIDIIQILDIDEKNEILSILVWVNMFWEDSSFSWNPAAYGNVKNIRFPATEIWTPDIILYNTDDINMGFHLGLPRDDEDQHFYAVARADGRMQLAYPQVFKSACKLDISEYPFDKQRCMMLFGSWSHDSSEVTVSIIGNEIKQDEVYTIANKAWQKSNAYCKQLKQKCSFDFSSECSVASCAIELKRTAWFEIISYTLPTIIIAILSLMVFMVPPEAGKRMEVGITLILCVAVYLSLINKKMPSTSESFPLVSQFYGCVIVEITVAMVCSCYCLHIYDPEGLRLLNFPNYLRTLAFGVLARLICYKTDGGKTSRVHPTSKVNNNESKKRKQSKQKSNGDIFYVKSAQQMIASGKSMETNFAGKMDDIPEKKEDRLNEDRSSNETTQRSKKTDHSSREKSKELKLTDRGHSRARKDSKLVPSSDLRQRALKENETRRQSEIESRKKGSIKSSKDDVKTRNVKENRVRNDSMSSEIKESSNENRREKQREQRVNDDKNGKEKNVTEQNREAKRSDRQENGKRMTKEGDGDRKTAKRSETKQDEEEGRKQTDKKEHRRESKNEISKKQKVDVEKQSVQQNNNEDCGESASHQGKERRSKERGFSESHATTEINNENKKVRERVSNERGNNETRSEAVLSESEMVNNNRVADRELRCDSGFGDSEIKNRHSIDSNASVALPIDDSMPRSDANEGDTTNTESNNEEDNQIKGRRAATIPLCGRNDGHYNSKDESKLKILTKVAKANHGPVSKSLATRPYTDSVVRRWQQTTNNSKARTKADLQLRNVLFAEIEGQSDGEVDASKSNSNASVKRRKEPAMTRSNSLSRAAQNPRTANSLDADSTGGAKTQGKQAVSRRESENHEAKLAKTLSRHNSKVSKSCDEDGEAQARSDDGSNQIAEITSVKDANDNTTSSKEDARDAKELFARRNWGVVKKTMQNRFTVQELFGQILSPKETNPIIAIANVLTRDQRKFVMRTEWMTSAMIFNRFFIILLGFSVIVSILAVFLQSSRLRDG
eukprot:gene7427-8249_t